MDDRTFDAIARRLGADHVAALTGTGRTRRTALGLLVGGTVPALLGVLGLNQADAKRSAKKSPVQIQKKKRRRKKKKNPGGPTPVSPIPVPCAKTLCSGACVDLNEDPDHCGSCGRACAENGICDGGTCACPSGAEVLCGNACVDTESDPEHCGNCETVCAGGEFCIAGGCVGGGQYRVVLRWDEDPSDLDSHLWLPQATPFHIAYYNEGSVGEFPFAILDRDDISSFGPETISVFQVQDGVYRYAVHNYSDDECCLDTSGAVVQLFQGGTLLREWEVPTGDGTALWWHVFDLASNGTLTSVDQLLPEAPAPYPDSATGAAVLSSRVMPPKTRGTAPRGRRSDNTRERGARRHARHRHRH